MKVKSAPFEVKAADSDTGTFEAIVSVFGNVDLIGDVVVPGAFKDSLTRWSEAGDPIPVVWSHAWDDPMSHIGVVEAAEERDDGLYVKGRLDVDDNPIAKQVHKLLKRRSVKEFSFAYDVVEGGPAERDSEKVYELRELDLIEVGPTLKGMNPDTQLLAAKAAEMQAQIQCATCAAAKSSLAGGGGDGGPATPEATPQEPAAATGKEPTGTPGADVLSQVTRLNTGAFDLT
jgi:uncharacterized protein